MKNLTLLMLIPLLAFLACEPTTAPTNGGENNPPSKVEDWIVVPGQRVGSISGNSTEQQLIEKLGAANVVRKEIGIGEGEVVKGNVLYPNTKQELIVIWESDQPYKKIDRIRIEKPDAPWKTAEGIQIGTSLDQLKTINVKDFNFYGFEWDYSGLTKDWVDGKISKQLGVFLEAENPEALFPDLIGEGLFSSSHPKADSAKLKVVSFYTEF